MSDLIRRAVVTGATGFVGSHLVQRLLADNCSVVAIVRPGASLVRLRELGVDTQIKVVPAQSWSGVAERVRIEEPDVVFHLASRFISEHRTEHVQDLIASNVLFGTKLVEAMTSAGALRLVNAGTSWQHYNDAVYDPVNLYAATKQALETIIQYYHKALGLNVIHLKLFDTYGPFDPRCKLIQVLIRSTIDGERLAMSPGEQLIDLVHVADVVDAFIRAGKRLIERSAEGLPTNESFAVSSGHPLSIRDLVSCFGQATGKTPRVSFGARSYRPREVMVPWQTGATLPGWEPRISLEQGLSDLYRAVVSRVHQSEDAE